MKKRKQFFFLFFSDRVPQFLPNFSKGNYSSEKFKMYLHHSDFLVQSILYLITPDNTKNKERKRNPGNTMEREHDVKAAAIENAQKYMPR